MPASLNVIIPTQRRPDSLARAARSVLRQTGIDLAAIELVIVDNDQRPSAQPLVAKLAAEAPFPVRYVHEPRAGVANARNAAVAASEAPFIAFLDDDEEAPDGWLAALLGAQARLGADVVFGPVRGRAPETLTRHRPYLEWFFSRLGPADERLIDEPYGCGCSLLRRAALPDPKRPFAERANETGGEDDVLFRAMAAAGATFGWAPEAWVWEDPIPSRLTLGYGLKRAFVYGQGPSYHAAHASPPDWPGVARWMAIGAAQAGVFGLLAAAKWAARRPDWAFTADRAMRGLGKVLWFDLFKLRLYGQPATSSQAATATPAPGGLAKARPAT